MKTLKFCTTAVLSGLVVGVLVGWHFGGVITKGRLLWEEMFASAGYGQLALVQCDQANPEHAREALVSFTDFSKLLGKLPSAKEDDALMIDAARAYLKLAAMEQVAGNPTLSHEYLLSAQESFKNAGNNIPEEKLSKEVTRLAALSQPISPPL
ncbi:MAG: hypothetical protein WAN17_05155 [Candidatus Sulfotelmatobacter sp.]